MSDLTVLKQQAAGFVAEINALAVTDAASYERAGQMVLAIAAYVRRVGEVLDPIVAAAHQAHRVAIAQRDGLLRPAQGARRVLSERMEAWDRAEAERRRLAEEASRQERERLEAAAVEVAELARRRLQAEAEDRRLAEAASLEAKGDQEGASRLLAQPVVVPMVTAAPVFAPRPPSILPPKVEGIAYRTAWEGEVIDLKALVRAVAEDKAPWTLVQADQVACNKLAAALRGALNVPGLRAVQKRSMSVRQP